MDRPPAPICSPEEVAEAALLTATPHESAPQPDGWVAPVGHDATVELRRRADARLAANLDLIHGSLSRLRGAEYTTIVTITLDASGALQGLCLAASSGAPEVDAAVSRAIRDAAPFAPPPPEVLHDGIWVLPNRAFTVTLGRSPRDGTLVPRVKGAARPKRVEIAAVPMCAPAEEVAVTAAMTEQAEVSPSDPRLTVGHEFMVEVRSRVNTRWKAHVDAISPSLRLVRPQYRTVVGINLDREGRLTGVCLDEASGEPALDRAVAQAFEEAAPFPAPPAELLRGRALHLRGLEFTVTLGSKVP
ncbi:MAG: energy transducer TonB [Myxococcota bacterium]